MLITVNYTIPSIQSISKHY